MKNATPPLSMSAEPASRLDANLDDPLYRRVAWRLVPFLMLCYVAAFLDRVNIGFAKLQMLDQLILARPSTALAPASSSSGIFYSRCRAMY